MSGVDEGRYDCRCYAPKGEAAHGHSETNLHTQRYRFALKLEAASEAISRRDRISRCTFWTTHNLKVLLAWCLDQRIKGTQTAQQTVVIGFRVDSLLDIILSHER